MKFSDYDHYRKRTATDSLYNISEGVYWFDKDKRLTLGIIYDKKYKTHNELRVLEEIQKSGATSPDYFYHITSYEWLYYIATTDTNNSVTDYYEIWESEIHSR